MATKKQRDARTVVIRNARLSFPHIYEPQEQENDDGSTRKTFNCVLMIPKEGNPQLKKILADMKADRPKSKQKWCLWDSKGKRILGRHPSREKALRRPARPGRRVRPTSRA